MIQSDTIAAICTAPGMGAISVVRVSGPDSAAIADRLFHCRGPKPSLWRPNTFHYGLLKRPDGAIIDEAILLVMRAPHSYTREDVVEFQVHGGTKAAHAALEAAIVAGARPAAPGEFTKRAFLNGRIDLVQAEAVMDLIRAGSDRAAKSAAEQIEGGLSRGLSAVYDELVRAQADIEATLDFQDGETPENLVPEAAGRLGKTAGKIKELLATWREGRMLREGASVVIAGMPNAGKSTLLNSLLGKDRAITSATPGTTRDVIEETMVFDGIPCRLTDTAGIRESGCEIEKEGVKRARQSMKNADVLIYMVDSSLGLRAEDMAVLKQADAGKTLLVLNKQDIGDRVSETPAMRVARTCLLSGKGVAELKAMISDCLGTTQGVEPTAAISERHRVKLVLALDTLDEALGILGTGREDMTAAAAGSLRRACEALGELLGRTFDEDLLDAVFSTFCVGK